MERGFDELALMSSLEKKECGDLLLSLAILIWNMWIKNGFKKLICEGFLT